VTLSIIEWHPLICNGPINMHSCQQNTVFSVGSVPKNYGTIRIIGGVWRSTKDYERMQRSSGVQFSSVGSQNNSRGVSSRKKMTVCQIVICELL
jgi:hypothetical protein